MDNNPIQGPVFLIETDRIVPNPYQPRRDFDEGALRELAESIREFGVLQPITVTKIEQLTESGTEVQYQLITGERRWRAAKLAGLERIPAIVKSVNLEKTKLELAIIENIQRENLNPIEAARAYARLQDEFHLTQREIASRLGKSRETIANTLRLLNLPSEAQEAIAQNKISESQGRLLLMVQDIAQQKQLLQELLHTNMSVRELKHKIQTIRKQKEVKPAFPTPDPEAYALQKQLEETLGTKVKVERNGDIGKIIISFYSPEELQGFLQRLGAHHNNPAGQPLNDSSQLEKDYFPPPQLGEESSADDFTI